MTGHGIWSFLGRERKGARWLPTFWLDIRERTAVEKKERKRVREWICIDFFPCSKHCVRKFTYITLFNLHNKPSWWVSLNPFFQIRKPKFREFNLPGYNQHSCFSEPGLGQVCWKRVRTSVNPESLFIMNARGILQHIPQSQSAQWERPWSLGSISVHKKSKVREVCS